MCLRANIVLLAKPGHFARTPLSPNLVVRVAFVHCWTSMPWILFYHLHSSTQITKATYSFWQSQAWWREHPTANNPQGGHLVGYQIHIPSHANWACWHSRLIGDRQPASAGQMLYTCVCVCVCARARARFLWDAFLLFWAMLALITCFLWARSAKKDRRKNVGFLSRSCPVVPCCPRKSRSCMNSGMRIPISSQ